MPPHRFALIGKTARGPHERMFQAQNENSCGVDHQACRVLPVWEVVAVRPCAMPRIGHAQSVLR